MPDLRPKGGRSGRDLDGRFSFDRARVPGGLHRHLRAGARRGHRRHACRRPSASRRLHAARFHVLAVDARPASRVLPELPAWRVRCRVSHAPAWRIRLTSACRSRHRVLSSAHAEPRHWHPSLHAASPARARLHHRRQRLRAWSSARAPVRRRVHLPCPRHSARPVSRSAPCAGRGALMTARCGQPRLASPRPAFRSPPASASAYGRHAPCGGPHVPIPRPHH